MTFKYSLHDRFLKTRPLRAAFTSLVFEPDCLVLQTVWIQKFLLLVSVLIWSGLIEMFEVVVYTKSPPKSSLYASAVAEWKHQLISMNVQNIWPAGIEKTVSRQLPGSCSKLKPFRMTRPQNVFFRRYWSVPFVSHIIIFIDETSVEKTGLLRGGWLHWQMLGLKEGTEEDCSGELKKGWSKLLLRSPTLTEWVG